MSKTTLVESAKVGKATESGEYRVRIIGSDVKGSSGYYSREMLEDFGPAAWPKGTKVYADHDMGFYDSLGVRSVKDIAGYFTSDPVMESDGLYATVKFGRDYQTLVEDFGEVIGMSISSSGSIDDDGTVLSIDPSPLNSVDLVTVPGANGAVLERLNESFRKVERKFAVDKEDILAIAEAVKAAIGPVLEALVPEEPKQPEETPDLVAATEAAVEAGLPKVGRARVVEAVKAGIEVEEAVKAETEYRDQIAESVKVDAEKTGVLHEGGSVNLDEAFGKLSIFGGAK